MKVEDIEISEMSRQRLGESLLLFYTGTTRTASNVLAEQKQNISDKFRILSEMRNQADTLAVKLMNGALESLGQTLREGWKRKKQLANGITNSYLDELCELAMSAGALGCKVTGAGGGGFFLVCVPPEHRAAVRQKLSHLREMPISLAEDGSKVIFNVRK